MKDILINVWDLQMVKEGEVRGREDEHYVMTLERVMAAYLWGGLPSAQSHHHCRRHRHHHRRRGSEEGEEEDVRFAVIMLQKSLV